MESYPRKVGLNCPLCLEPFSETKYPYILSCGHNICYEDLYQLKTPDCPLCRKVND